jgi:hypothetical protein
MEKYAARAVKQDVDRILWEVWDPIGVNQYPDARDEYSSYVNGVFELLAGGASDDLIAQHLVAIVCALLSRRFGMSLSRPNWREIAI